MVNMLKPIKKESGRGHVYGPHIFLVGKALLDEFRATVSKAR